MNILDYTNLLDFYQTGAIDDIAMFTTKKNHSKTSEEILNDNCINYAINQENIASCTQIHSNVVTFIEKSGVYKNADGLVTYLDSGVVLKIQTADCVPIFMIDRNKGIIGLVHSGWKGTRDSIILSALKIFIKHGSKCKNIVICIGPCIKECCYEIKEDVSQFFKNTFIINKNNKLFLNLISKIKDDLYNNGIENIYESDVCTYHDNNFHSYRKEKGSDARMYSIIGKKH
jgi:YfiH family protein